MKEIFHILSDFYGPQNWWPVDKDYHKQKGTDFRDEIIISAILTQNTSWSNVEKALQNIKLHGELSLEFVRRVELESLKEIIKPSGFYNQKAETLRRIAKFINPTDIVEKLRKEELLRLRGIGRETSDVILLYAGQHLTFVIDKYTQRLTERLFNLKGSYETLKIFFEENLPKDIHLYKEFHALIDEHGKRFCKRTPSCKGCPLGNFCLFKDPSL